jgi:hypothetical protein
MKLRDLKANFIRIIDEKSYRIVDTLPESQGIIFLCPKCYVTNKGVVGTHSVICWFRHRGVPDDYDPKPGRWTPNGTGLDDLTFIPGVPPIAVSVLLTGDGCGWHGFIRNGDASLS